MYSANNSLTTRRDSGETRLDDLTKEIYSLQESREAASVNSILKIQAFRTSAGFTRTQILNCDRWLSQISINSMLRALAQGISLSGEPTTIDEIILQCDLMLETSDNHKSLECNISKLAAADCNAQTLRIFDKLLTKANKGCITVKASTVLSIFQKETSLLDKWCEHLYETPKEELSHCWMLNISSQDALLYQLVCENLFKNYKGFLPEFVQHIQMESNIIPLYSCEEQPCVLLLAVKLPDNIDMASKMFHIKKVMKELFSLWLTTPNSVLKLINHFPVLIEWMVNHSDNDYHIKSLCLCLINHQSLKVI